MQAWYLLYCKRGQLQRAQEHLERQSVNCLMPTIALEKIIRGKLVSMIEYSAIAGTIGAGGIGYLAVVYGYQRFDNHIMIATIVALIATIQLIQFLGDRLVNRLRHTQGNLV